MNWLDPAEVEAWLNRYSDNGREFVAKDNLIQALEQFVRALATEPSPDEVGGPFRGFVERHQAVARLLVKAMGEK